MSPEMERQILEDEVWPRTYTQLMTARRLAERPVPITSAEWTLLAEGWLEEDEMMLKKKKPDSYYLQGEQ